MKNKGWIVNGKADWTRQRREKGWKAEGQDGGRTPRVCVFVHTKNRLKVLSLERIK